MKVKCSLPILKKDIYYSSFEKLILKTNLNKKLRERYAANGTKLYQKVVQI